ncbi:MAG: cytochrome d ubiquinol oxidase subunit II [Kofleriaceae bacterium]|nr:cytochrome d ubiquinol oxidase subunit II [Kofleriaceae bacterium]
MFELFAAGTILVALVIYALTGGADFGGGIWDLFASGPRAQAQRDVIEDALSPVWEANHVWLIFAVVMLFTAFPPAFAAIGIELHIPITLLLVGIVLRGSAFVFRQYGNPRWRPRWSPVFAVSSLVAAMFLGVVIGATTSGDGWFRAFPFAVGLLTITAFAFLAATYLTLEPSEIAVREDFRQRALVAGLVLAFVAVVCAVLARGSAVRFAAGLFGSPVMAPIFLCGTLALIGTLGALMAKRYRIARVGAAATVALLIVGWGVGHYPMLVAPDLTIAAAAAPRATLHALAPIVVIGTALVVPTLWWLIRTFKRGPRGDARSPVSTHAPHTDG